MSAFVTQGGHKKLNVYKIDRKSPILTYPICIRRPRWNDPIGISLSSLAPGN